jgi:SNF2 family DNA or RNA helicase
MYDFKTQPYKHQRQVLKHTWWKREWAYLLEMGTGKSKLCIDNVGILFEKRKIDTFIVVAPKGVYQNWNNLEIPAHLPDRIERKTFVWRAGLGKKKQADLMDFLDAVSRHHLRIFIINIEALSTTKGQQVLDFLLRNSVALLAVDESTAIKNPKAKRTKSLIKLGALAAYRRILTGFPVTQSPLDIWAQARFLNEELLDDCGDSFFKFQHRFAIMKRKSVGTHSFNMIVGFRDIDRLTEMLKRFSSRLTKEECLDLPEKIYTRRNVSLTDQQRHIYNEVKEFALAEISETEFMTATNVMTQLLRLQQVLSGHTKSDSGTLVEIPDNRLEELLHCVEETSGKIIIWSRFRYDIQRITEALITAYGPTSTVSYYGDTSDDDRVKAVKRFQEGAVRFFVGNPQTGGFGLTLTAASTVVYFANSFDLAIRMQSEDRAHRIGQKNNVTYVDLIAEGTIDEKIVKALRSKMDIASTVLGEEFREWLT